MKRKVLIINTVPFVMGGISSVIVNYYKTINKSKFQLDIVVNDYIEPEFEVLFNTETSKIYKYSRNHKPINYMHWLYKIIVDNRYDVVHVHGNSATMTIELLAAKLAGCPVRIAHSHNSECGHKVFHALLSPLFKRLYTSALACSELAGDWIFGKGKYKVLPNGIEIEKYKFSEEIRNRVRKELSLEGKLVIGHIGFMNEQKNHPKLFEIIAEMKQKKDNVHLLCVTGDSNMPDNLQIMIEEKEIEEYITVLYKRNDVNELLQAMDIFVFPSKWEGLGVVLLEAQASGLPCVVSDRVPDMVNVTRNVVFLELESKADKWIESINSMYGNQKSRSVGYNNVKESMFNIANSIDILSELYL